jgi:hypothetical protein
MTGDLSAKLSDYQEGLMKAGLKCYRGPSDDLWLAHEGGTMMRIPTFRVNPPSAPEFSTLFWGFRTPAISYIIEPDDTHQENTWLYICRKGDYGLGKLTSAARRNVKRAQKNLRFEPVSWDLLLEYGATAYCDTRSRVGLSDGTLEGFQAHFSRLSRIPGHRIMGAWYSDALVAFTSLIVVDDWVEIQGLFSANEQLDLRPNDGLFAYILDYFLIQGHFDTVSYGLSSSQQVSNAAGLHRFKRKIGFQAQPVHRVFAVHPLIRPLVNPLSLATLEALQRVNPKDRRIKKATGMLDTLIKKRGLPDMGLKEETDDTAPAASE